MHNKVESTTQLPQNLHRILTAFPQLPPQTLYGILQTSQHTPPWIHNKVDKVVNQVNTVYIHHDMNQAPSLPQLTLINHSHWNTPPTSCGTWLYPSNSLSFFVPNFLGQNAGCFLTSYHTHTTAVIPTLFWHVTCHNTHINYNPK